MKRIDCSFMGISGECFIHITLEFENIPRKGDKVVLSRNIAEYVRENMTNDVENAEEYADIISMSLDKNTGTMYFFVVEVIHYPRIDRDVDDEAITRVILSSNSLDKKKIKRGLNRFLSFYFLLRVQVFS